MHTLIAAGITKENYDAGQIDQGLYDKKWEYPPCKIYLFEEKPNDVRDLVQALGQEDNEDYKMVKFNPDF